MVFYVVIALLLVPLAGVALSVRILKQLRTRGRVPVGAGEGRREHSSAELNTSRPRCRLHRRRSRAASANAPLPLDPDWTRPTVICRLHDADAVLPGLPA
jgi:hypothetical protein